MANGYFSENSIKKIGEIEISVKIQHYLTEKKGQYMTKFKFSNISITF